MHGLSWAPVPLAALLWKVLSCCLLVREVLYVLSCAHLLACDYRNTHCLVW